MKKVLLLCLMFVPVMLLAQISDGGEPLSFSYETDREGINTRTLDAPNIQALLDEDQKIEAGPAPYRIGHAIPVEIDFIKEATLTNFSRHEQVFRMAIRSEGAKALILYYRKFSIPEGGKVFIYSEDKSQLIGAFTSRNNLSGGYFATEMIYGEELIIEYEPPFNSNTEALIEIYQVHYVYRDAEAHIKGSSGPCEVNVNCPEGQGWQNEKRSVAKIVLKAGSGTYLCTGSLINNVRRDSTPYFLTAKHCGSNASLSDYNQWVFFFNYEASFCEDPSEDPTSNTITGSSLIAQAPGDPSSGSDFKLLQLSSIVPDNYNPSMAGWNRNGLASSSGVGIHHPKGDIKKISTYTSDLISTNYSQTSPDPNGMYWKVVWAETASGHGVTEGGSSGSPIFNPEGSIVGTLTGGLASCSDLTAPDYYGKLAYHWSSNGSAADEGLSYWLDPDNTGAQSIDGMGYGNLLSANFSADTSVISIGSSISFNDQSGGDPESWEWTFLGASPSNYSGQSPSGIAYFDYGTYDVQLVVGKASISDTLLRKNYIRVTPNVYPNPAHDFITIDFGRRQLDYVTLEIFDMQGRKAGSYESNAPVTGIWKTPLVDLNTGTYILRIRTNLQDDRLRVVIY